MSLPIGKMRGWGGGRENERHVGKGTWGLEMV